MRRRIWHVFTTLTLCVALASLVNVATFNTALANDVSGFRYGTDTSCGISQGSAPYGNDYSAGGGLCGTGSADLNGGFMGGYIGQADGYQYTLGCSGAGPSISSQWGKAITNWNDGYGFGVGLYWFTGGPGADPIYYTDYVNAGDTTPTNYSNTDAYNWGKKQGQEAINAYDFWSGYYPGDLLPTVFLDAEWDTGWNEVLVDSYSSSGCGGIASSSACCSTTLDRQTFDGFTDAIAADTTDGLFYSAFSSYDFWNSATFACGSCTSGNGYIPHTYEWTFGTDGSNGPADPPINPPPGQSGASSGWCQYIASKNSYASFFGGQSTSSSYAYMWQWSEAADSGNGVADFDQFDESRMGYP